MVPSFFPPPRFIRVPCSTAYCPYPLSFRPICLLSARVSVFSRPPPLSGPPIVLNKILPIISILRGLGDQTHRQTDRHTILNQVLFNNDQYFEPNSTLGRILFKTMGGPDNGGGRLNTLTRAERRQIGRKERGDGQDFVEQGTWMNLGGGENEGTKPSRRETYKPNTRDRV